MTTSLWSSCVTCGDRNRAESGGGAAWCRAPPVSLQTCCSRLVSAALGPLMCAHARCGVRPPPPRPSPDLAAGGHSALPAPAASVAPRGGTPAPGTWLWSTDFTAVLSSSAPGRVGWWSEETRVCLLSLEDSPSWTQQGLVYWPLFGAWEGPGGRAWRGPGMNMAEWVPHRGGPMAVEPAEKPT